MRMYNKRWSVATHLQWNATQTTIIEDSDASANGASSRNQTLDILRLRGAGQTWQNQHHRRILLTIVVRPVQRHFTTVLQSQQLTAVF